MQSNVLNLKRMKHAMTKLWAIEGGLKYGLDLDLLNKIGLQCFKKGIIPKGYDYPELYEFRDTLI